MIALTLISFLTDVFLQPRKKACLQIINNLNSVVTDLEKEKNDLKLKVNMVVLMYEITKSNDFRLTDLLEKGSCYEDEKDFLVKTINSFKEVIEKDYDVLLANDIDKIAYNLSISKENEYSELDEFFLMRNNNLFSEGDNSKLENEFINKLYKILKNDTTSDKETICLNLKKVFFMFNEFGNKFKKGDHLNNLSRANELDVSKLESSNNLNAEYEKKFNISEEENVSDEGNVFNLRELFEESEPLCKLEDGENSLCDENIREKGLCLFNGFERNNTEFKFVVKKEFQSDEGVLLQKKEESYDKRSFDDQSQSEEHSNDQSQPEEESQSEDYPIIQSQSIHSNDQSQSEEYLNDHPQLEEELQSKDFPIIKSMLAEHSNDQSQSEEESQSEKHSSDHPQSEEELQSKDFPIIKSILAEHSYDQSQSEEESQSEEYLNDHPQLEEELQSKDFPIIKSILAEHSYDQSQSEEESQSEEYLNDHPQLEEELQSKDFPIIKSMLAEHSNDQSQSKEHSGEVQKEPLEQKKYLFNLEDFIQQYESLGNSIAFLPFTNNTLDSSPGDKEDDLQLSNYQSLPKKANKFSSESSDLSIIYEDSREDLNDSDEKDSIKEIKSNNLKQPLKKKMNKKLKRRSRKKFRKPRNKLRKKSCPQKEKINEINCYFGDKFNILKIINEFYENKKWFGKKNYSKKITKVFYYTLVYLKNKIGHQISNESIEKEIFEEIVYYSTQLMDENEERDVYDMISKKLIFLTKLKKKL